MEAAVCREGNTVQRLRDEGVGKAGLVAIKVPVTERRGRVGSRIGSRLQVGGLGRVGLGFRGGDGIA